MLVLALAEPLALAFLRIDPRVAIQIRRLLLRRGPVVRRRLVAVRAVLARLGLALLADEPGEARNPIVEPGHELGFTRHVLGLVVAVLAAHAEALVVPQVVGDLDPAEPALPHEALVG